MEKKIDTLRAHMNAERWQEALRMAARFPRLGAHRARIVDGAEAMTRPDFYRQIGRDAGALVADGIAALRERYP